MKEGGNVMAVVTVATMQVKPDGMEALMERFRKAKTIFESAGGRNVRVLSGVVAGEATGMVTFLCESDDFAQFGALMDKVSADPEIAAQTANTSDSPVPGYQLTVWVDLPL